MAPRQGHLDNATAAVPSPFDVDVPAAVARIQARNSVVGAFVSTRLPEALAEHAALALEAPRSPIHGAPFSLKDQWDTASLPTTGGSWRHRNRKPTADCSVVSTFRDAGGVLVGKTNLSDLGLAPEATSWVGGSARNPHDLARTAGGSSGGASAAVADGMSAFDWGTDIGGSIRQPAAFCGLYGMKLSSEAWPITGAFPEVPHALARLCGQGPLTRTLAGMRAVLTAARPLRTGPAWPSFVAREAALLSPGSGTMWSSFAGDVRGPLECTLGAVTNADLPSTRETQWLYNGIWCSHFLDLFEADPSLSIPGGIAAVLAAVFLRGRFDKRIHPTTAELLLQIALGRATLFRDKKRILDRVRDLQGAFERLWSRGAVVVMPVCAYPAPRVGWTNLNPRLLECTVQGNMADATGLALPWGSFDAQASRSWAQGTAKGGARMPRAIQLLGPPGSELALIELAERLEPLAPRAR